ncbi:hypothetical protein SK128_004273 [Halocaridina rubra]|uniref:C2H2-type domain-containing protein n=1 Tax=Halocaridina rubra TaxID=373956 RepID=A0AAN8WL80_HALRR
MLQYMKFRCGFTAYVTVTSTTKIQETGLMPRDDVSGTEQYWNPMAGTSIDVNIDTQSQDPLRVDAPPKITMSSSGCKLYHCSVCEYRTPNSIHLQYHMRSHTGEKPFSCPYCSYRASQKTHLKTHMRTHTGEKPYACQLCDFRSAQNGNLRKHMSKHHS